MKEYKIIKGGFFKKDSVMEDSLNKYGREGWGVVSSSFNQGGQFIKFLLERDKNRMS